MTGFNSKRKMAADKDALFEKFEVAQPAQEPPKYAIEAYWEDDGRIGVVATVERPDGGYHLLGAIIDPPKRKWVGLTDQESIDIIEKDNNYKYPIQLLQAVMDALKAKNA